jgi:hypothetical protein
MFCLNAKTYKPETDRKLTSRIFTGKTVKNCCDNCGGVIFEPNAIERDLLKYKSMVQSAIILLNFSSE